MKRNSPRLGPGWKLIGMINVSDVAYIEAAFKKQKIIYKLTPPTRFEKSDPKTKKYKELWAATGYRRDAMKLMKFLFRKPRGE